MRRKIIAVILLAAVLISIPGCGFITTVKDRLYQPPDWNTVQPDTPRTGGLVKYYYYKLSNKEKIAYSNIFKGVTNFEDKIEIPELNQDELSTVFSALLYDNPEFFHMKRVCNLSSSGNRCYFNAFYCMGKDEYYEKLTQLRQKINEIVSGISFSEDQYDAELYIHDYIVTNCTYSNTDDQEESSAYGALIKGCASCEGYSKAAQMLFDRMGIESYVLAGQSTPNEGSEPESHMWNVVRINGEYYYLDLTWDDPVKEDGTESLRHVYFNMSDEELALTHSNYENLNVCEAETDNYFVRNKLVFGYYDNGMKKALVRLLSDAYQDGRLSVEVKFTGQKPYKDAIQKLISDNKIYTILSEVIEQTNAKIDRKKISYISNDKFNIVEIIMVPKK